MTKNLMIPLILLLFVLAGCNGSGTEQVKESNSKEAEPAVEVKETPEKPEAEEAGKSEKEEKSETAEKKPAPAKDNELSNVENLLGNWFKPHEASINIKFYRDGRFEFNDYNSQKDEEELLEGKYELKNGTLTLMYDDRPKQNFKFYRDGGQYYIKKGEYYFVKGDN